MVRSSNGGYIPSNVKKKKKAHETPTESRDIILGVVALFASRTWKNIYPCILIDSLGVRTHFWSHDNRNGDHPRRYYDRFKFTTRNLEYRRAIITRLSYDRNLLHK